ncbi:twin-arginine translocation signal domain-containing protein, partial [Mycobacterium tuberculosis]|uniref:twin-arginine translocation signal domain-containing protein n=1 Tax=Mycobacterium tuberculosis TaxID=1773 RepID=UPI003DA75C00
MLRAAPVINRLTNRPISRRGVLAGGAALAALGVVSACGESAPKAPRSKSCARRWTRPDTTVRSQLPPPQP